MKLSLFFDYLYHFFFLETEQIHLGVVTQFTVHRERLPSFAFECGRRRVEGREHSFQMAAQYVFLIHLHHLKEVKFVASKLQGNRSFKCIMKRANTCITSVASLGTRQAPNPKKEIMQN